MSNINQESQFMTGRCKGQNLVCIHQIEGVEGGRLILIGTEISATIWMDWFEKLILLGYYLEPVNWSPSKSARANV